MEMEIIGYVETGYAEKFGVPRQPRLVPSARGRVVFGEAFRGENFLRGIEGFSHIWLVFQLHQALWTQGKSMVRPPRLGGNERRGVFATRASYRPNAIGMSAVELVRVEEDPKLGLVLEVSGVDLVDGTPLLDVKPYVPFSDSVENAKSGFVTGEPERLQVRWECEKGMDDASQLFIEETLALDPRPAYQMNSVREYGCTLDGWELRWGVVDGRVLIRSAVPVSV